MGHDETRYQGQQFLCKERKRSGGLHKSRCKFSANVYSRNNRKEACECNPDSCGYVSCANHSIDWSMQKNIQSTGCAVRDGRISEMLAHKKNSGRKRKTAAVEEQIIAELETGSYHTRQQIADMIKEKFQITISLPAVGRLLKKRF